MKSEHKLVMWPNADKIEFKDKFIERYSLLTDWETFRTYSMAFLRRCIRINTLKKDIREVKGRLESKGWKLTPVPWCDHGFWIESERRDLGNLIEHSLGYIYVQEAASMIPPIALDPQPGETILDMCAAPGSKTTQIAQYMENKGLLIANDSDHKRVGALGVNLQRCGITNTAVTIMNGIWFKKAGMMFDRILLDAPCSGTGTIRKSSRVTYEWSPDNVKRISGQQKGLIRSAWNILKPGGTMVYSTCTLEPEENEAVIDHLLENFGNAKIMPINLNINSSGPVTEFKGAKYNNEVSKCLRIWPQDNNTEGFFVAKIKKLK